MKTIKINIYKFSELSETAKQKAIENLSDTNVNYDWWESVYEDANTIGLKITGFDIDRGSYCTGEFLLSTTEIAQNIINNHGEMCETYINAENFLDTFEPIFANYMDENHIDYESRESEDKMIDLENDFKNSLLEDYRIMLQKEYEYLTSKEAIIETIEANDYDFNEDGSIY